MKSQAPGEKSSVYHKPEPCLTFFFFFETQSHVAQADFKLTDDLGFLILPGSEITGACQYAQFMKHQGLNLGLYAC